MIDPFDDIPLAITSAIDTISTVLSEQDLPDTATQKLAVTRNVLRSTRDAATLREMDFEALEDAYCEAIIATSAAPSSDPDR